MKKVFVNGYGSIGSRIAQFIKDDSEIEVAISDCDLVIDAAPSGHGFLNKKNLYEPKDIMAIYQGGETIYGEKAVSDLLFNSRVNYKQAIGKKHVMQGSCNVT